MSGWKLMESLEDLKKVLDEAKTIAVVGLSEKPERESHSTSLYLKGQGYRIVGVNPSSSRILDEPCYPSLSEMPDEVRRTVDLVVIFRRPEDAAAILQEASRLGLKRIWLPPGSSSPALLASASRLDLAVVVEKCLRTAHQLTHSRPGK